MNSIGLIAVLRGMLKAERDAVPEVVMEDPSGKRLDISGVNYDQGVVILIGREHGKKAS